MNLFNYQKIWNDKERLYGGALRLFGLDFLATFNGWLDDWTLLDIRILRSNGVLVYLQVLGLILFIGRNDLIYEPKEYLHL